ncbi:hypothetical protein O3P69_003419 [Scylla paramamosain]|uniref:Uncharacterized protein n=1 Tax=Scylla paramamosain TaxID=85552 RepID=A0AAW0UHJ2_SCYPA
MEQDAVKDTQSENQVKDLVKETRNHTRLYWNYLRLQSLPHGLTENGSHVEQLHLKCNLLTKLPEKFGCLTHLTHCFLNSNSLESLPDSLGDLKSLKILDVANNNLTSLPVTLAKLSSLRSLVVVHNNLKSFPLELCGLKSLSILMLSGNYITSLPEAVKGLTGLQGLYIDHNLLKELPRSLAFLPILTRVSCCCNNIAYLPALPFASKPTIYFDNCEVNYLPITLVCHLHSGPTWDTIILHACGYFPEMVIEKNTVSITLSQSGKQKYPHSLVLPPQIRKMFFALLSMKTATLQDNQSQAKTLYTGGSGRSYIPAGRDAAKNVQGRRSLVPLPLTLTTTPTRFFP